MSVRTFAWVAFGAALLVVVLHTPLPAQIPGAPAVPAAPAIPGAPPAPGVPATPVAVPTQPTTLWSFLGISQENCQKCRQCICSCPLGQMLNNMTLPLQFASGGLIGPLCPPLSAADLAKLTDPNNLAVSPEEAVAAKIKADEATVKQRIAALRYLATVDCHYYPEAGDAIIDALRKDRNECVRYEAALALTRGCCCNKKTLAALILAVNGQDTDGNPSETSPRVKNMALNALNLCMGHVSYFAAEPTPPELPPEPELQPPEPPSPAAQGAIPRVQLTAFYTQYLPKVRRDDLLQIAGRVLAEAAAASPSARPAAGHGGVLDSWQKAQIPLSLREEISFDEAALTTPGRPLSPSGAAPSSMAKATPAPAASPVRPVSNIESTTGRAGLSFTSSASAPVTSPPNIAAPTSPTPVPWPVSHEGTTTGTTNAGGPTPVPWPVQ